jgi:acetyl-CoA acyltransferase
MAAAVIKATIERAEGFDPSVLDDVIMGCAMPEAEQGMNVARIATLRAGLPHTVPAQTVNRFCSSGLQTVALAAQQIMAGMGDAIIAGGTESMSMVSMAGNAFAPNPALVEVHPEVYMGMGLTGENVARQYGISREEQDEFALRSHQNGGAAIEGGKFRDEIVPLDVEVTVLKGDKAQARQFTFDVDEGVRRDTSREALAKLKPVFAVNGTVTAGNASQTSDGAAALLVMSREKADELGLKPLAVIKQLEIDLDKVNVNGGAIALGHPLGCTGAKLTVTLLNEMRRRGSRYGMVTMCIGGGMGAAGIFENLT